MVNITSTITFLYKNYRGKVSKRTVHNPELFYGHSLYHGVCWMIKGYDSFKQECREFKILDIQELQNE